MDKETQEYKKFLDGQLEWCKKQVNTLGKIEDKLYEMKEIAKYAFANDVTTDEFTRLNRQLETLQEEIQTLEKQLHTVVH